MTSLSVLVPVYNEQHLVATSLAGSRSSRPRRTSSASRSSSWTTARATRRPSVLRPSPRRAASTWPRTGPLADGVGLLGARPQGTDRVGLPPPRRRTAERARPSGPRSRRRTAPSRSSTTPTSSTTRATSLRIVKVFVEEEADAVFGSRFAGGEARRALLFRHELGNRLLTFLTNLVTNVNLTDMETCYKAVRTDLLRSIPIVSNDFRLEPELTIKLAKREARIFEIPISYSGRTYQEGKKINWRDGVKALLRHPPLLALRPRLRRGRVRLAHPRPHRPRAALQRLDGRHHPPLVRPEGARDRQRHRQPHQAPRPAQRLRRLGREPALPPDAARPHLRPALPRRHPHRRHPRASPSRASRAASTRWCA